MWQNWHHISVFPATGENSKLFCVEQGAAKRGCGSDLTALALSLIREAYRGNPLYLSFTDVDAYDNVWREALFAKLLASHPEIQDIKVLQKLYGQMHAYIQQGAYRSKLIISALGIAQGDPLSAV